MIQRVGQRGWKRGAVRSGAGVLPWRWRGWLAGVAAGVLGFLGMQAADLDRAEWAAAQDRPAMTAEEASAFLRRLCDYVVQHHVKFNESSAQLGMVYEYQRPGRQGQFGEWVQSERGDTMGVGAWFGTALIDAWRATGDKHYREVLMRWPLPFYLRLVNEGGRRFERGPGASEAALQLPAPERRDFLAPADAGFVPFWWDDGQSLSLEMARKRAGTLSAPGRWQGPVGTNGAFRLNGYSYLTAGRLSEPVALLLMQAWLVAQGSTEREERGMIDELAAASGRLQASRARHGDPDLLMVTIADGMVRRDREKLMSVVAQEWTDVFREPVTYWEALRPSSKGVAENASGAAIQTHYRYYANLPGSMSLGDQVAWRTVLDAFTAAQPDRFYADDLIPPPGLTLSDLEPLAYRDGRPADYRSDRIRPGSRLRAIGGRRGPELMVAAGWGLQALSARPGLWDLVAAGIEDPRVAISNDTAGVGTTLRFTGLEVKLSSSPTHLRLRGRMDEGVAPLVLRIQNDSGRTNAGAVLTLNPLSVRVANHQGETLVYREDWEEDRFDVEIPYTLVKGQRTWLNAVEWGRMALSVGEERQWVVFSSSEARVKAALRRELAGGLRVWEAIFDAYGYLPSAIGAGPAMPNVSWDELSDAGLYAQLMRACAQWLNVLQGRRDWEQQRVPPLEAPPENAGEHGTR